MRKSRADVARPVKTPLRGVTDRALIRELFVERAHSYDIADALRLTRSTEAEIAAAIERGIIDASGESRRLRIEWADVAHLALERWTPRMVSGALDVFHIDA